MSTTVFWILYAIVALISFVSFWASITIDDYGKVHMKRISRGEFVLDIIVSAIPIVNAISAVISSATYFFQTDWCNKPLFKK